MYEEQNRKYCIYHFQRNPSLSENNMYIDSSPSIDENASSTDNSERKIHIHNKLGNWYSPLCNRWFSLLGVNLLLLYFITSLYYFTLLLYTLSNL